MLAFPSRTDLISVPVSWMPAVYSSNRKNSKEARLFFMLTEDWMDAGFYQYKAFVWPLNGRTKVEIIFHLQ